MSILWVLLPLMLVVSTQGRAQTVPSALTNAQQILKLSSEEAQQKKPVDLHGVVTLYSPGDSLLFVADSSAGIYVYASWTGLNLKRGDWVRVLGMTNPGRYSRIAYATNITVIAHNHPMPAPRSISHADLQAGLFDSQWVRLQGVIRSQKKYTTQLFLELEKDRVNTSAIVLGVDEKWAGNLIGRETWLEGVAVASYDQSQKPSGFILYVPALSFISLLPQPLKPTNHTVRELVTHPLRGVDGIVCTVQGVITLSLPGKGVVLQDQTGGVFLSIPDDARLGRDDLIQATGLLTGTDGPARLKSIQHSSLGSVDLPMPVSTTLEALKKNEHALCRIKATGLVTGVKADETSIHLSIIHDQTSLEMVLLQQETPVNKQKYEQGHLLEFVGVCMPEWNEEGRVTAQKIVVVSQDDIKIVERPGIRTLKIIGGISGFLLVVAALGLAWLTLLRRSVRRETAILRQREALLESRYLDLFENAYDIIFSLDAAERIENMNQVGEHTLGYSRMELKTKQFSDLACPDDRDRLRMEISSASALSKTRIFEAGFWAKNGRHVILEIKLNVLYNEGNAIGFRGIAHDITEQRLTEETLRRNTHELRKLLAERENLGRDLHDELIQSLYAIGLTMEASRLEMATDARQAEQKLKIARQALKENIVKIRDFIGLLQPKKQPHRHFDEGVQSIISDLDPARIRQYVICLDEVTADKLEPQQAIQLLQIVREGLSNSLRHSEATRIEISLLANKAGIGILQIADNGKGFSVDTPRGCGLQNMDSRSEKLGGKLEINSSTGQGTKITLLF